MYTRSNDLKNFWPHIDRRYYARSQRFQSNTIEDFLIYLHYTKYITYLPKLLQVMYKIKIQIIKEKKGDNISIETLRHVPRYIVMN